MPASKVSFSKESFLTLTIAILYFPVRTLAVSNLQYFNSADCQQTHLISSYVSSTPDSEDTACHVAPAGTLAVWIDSLDSGCSARTFSDTACANPLGLSLYPGTCYLPPPGTSSSDPTTIAAVRIVCGAVNSANPLPSDLSTTSIVGIIGDPQLAPSNTSTWTGTWDGSTNAEALGRPTNTSGASSSEPTITVDPTTFTGSLPTLSTTILPGTGNTTITGNLTTWSNTMQPTTSTTRSTLTRTITDDANPTQGGGGGGGSGAQSTTSGYKPGQGGAGRVVVGWVGGGGDGGWWEISMMLTGALLLGWGLVL